MTAICGVIYSNGHCAHERGASVGTCRSMADAQAHYGPHGRSVRTHLSDATSDAHANVDVAFGRAMFRLLPEDRHDAQPLTGGGGRFFLVADLRIDNRAELAAELGVDLPRLATMSDADVLLAAFERWDEDVVDHLVGDFAFAVWDARTRRLILARDPFGQRPLCFHQSGGVLTFASMPVGIHASGRVVPAPDRRRIAEYMTDLILPNGQSFFDGVRVVKPGQILVFSDGGSRGRMYWNPSRQELRLGSTANYVDAFRAQLDQAVACRLRGSEGFVGAHLSSGWDSSAVAATAARLLAPTGGRVLALTSAPRLGFVGPPIRGRISDESAVAAVTAALHPNMEHLVVRPAGTPVFALLKASIAAAQHPLGHVCNNVWWSAINQAAAERGARIVLTGEMGNHTISAGNLFQLADLVRTGKWARWAHEARALLRAGGINWRGVAANSFGPWMPRSFWKLISHAFLDTPLGVGKPPLLVADWSAEMMREVGKFGRGVHPPRDSFQHRLRFLRSHDGGNTRKMALARWGVDERDPTVDRRLVEFCLSLPLDMLVKDGVRRPLARAALADRLPADVLDSKVRGYQMADWYEQITAADARASFEEVRHSAAAGAVIDLDRLDAAIASWPTSGWEKMSVEYDYRGDVLHALSAAHFIDGVGRSEGPCDSR